MRCIESIIAGSLLRGDGGVQLAGGDLFCGRGDVAELAGGEVSVGSSHGWSEGAADDGAVLVEVAGARSRIEDGAGLVFPDSVFSLIGKEVGVFVVFAENACGEITWEERSEPTEGVVHSCGDAGSSLGIATL